VNASWNCLLRILALSLELEWRRPDFLRDGLLLPSYFLCFTIVQNFCSSCYLPLALWVSLFHQCTSTMLSVVLVMLFSLVFLNLSLSFELPDFFLRLYHLFLLLMSLMCFHDFISLSLWSIGHLSRFGCHSCYKSLSLILFKHDHVFDFLPVGCT